MADIFSLLYLVLALYSNNIDLSQPEFLQDFIVKTQLAGIDAAIESIEGTLPELTVDAEPINYEDVLKALGYYKNESKDNKLNLRNAILRFKSNCNIPLSGSWDDKYSTILSIQLKTNTIKYEDTVDNPPSKGKWIVINKSKRILTLYEGNTVIYKYPIAVGNPPSLTPDGKFKIVTKIVNPAWGGGGYAKPVKGGIPANPLGYRWLGLSYKSGGDIEIHGNNSPYSIGENVSRGCIRMINSDVEQLFEIVPISTHVWIGTDERLKKWGIFQKELTA